MKYFHELQLKGKRVVKRADLNSPVTEDGAITINPRLERHGESIRMLSDEGAKVIVIAHQGRRGKPDFISLRKHALVLETITQRKVEFLDSMDPEKVKEAVGKMKDGDILLLENVRMSASSSRTACGEGRAASNPDGSLNPASLRRA